MKRKLINSLRLLLVAAGLCVGASNAWGAAGDITTLFSIDFSNDLVQGTSAGTGIYNYTCAGSTGTLTMAGYRSSGSALNPSISAGGTLCFGCVGTASYTPSAGVKDSIQIEFDFAQGEVTGKSVYFRTFDGDTKVGDCTFNKYAGTFSANTFGLDISDMNSAGKTDSNWATHNHIKIIYNYETGYVSVRVTKYTNTTDEGATVVRYSAFDTSKQINKFVFGTDYTARLPQIDNLVITKKEGDYSSTADVTLAFKDDSDNDISGLYTGQTVFTVDKSTTFTPSNYYPTAMYDGDYKYTYTSGGDAFTVTGDKTVTLVYTKGARPTHTLNVTANYGSKNLTIVNNVSVQEESNYTYYYPRYIKDGTTLYQYTSSTDPGASATYWTSTTTMSTTNLSYTLTYEPVDGVCVYYSEGENIASKTGTYGQYPDVSSGGTTGVFEAGDGNLVVSLPAGVYTITARTVGRGDGGRDILFYKGSVSEENKVLTATPGYSGATATSGAISITETTNILVNGAPGGGPNGRGLDYVYIMKTAESKTITSAGWATYCSPYALDFSGDIANLTEVYIVTGGSAGVLTKTSVKGGTVHANTGLLLKGTEGTVTIPVVASSSTDVSANKLVGVTANTEIDAETGYVLMNDATYGLAFYKNKNAFTVGANTAYLPADFAGGGARFDSFSFADETTGITQIENGKSNIENSVYNLNGQRVSKPKNGLYIVNGKKVIVK